MSDMAEEYYLERVDHDDGVMVYEIHGGKVIDYVCDTFIVFHGNAAKDNAEKCLAALQRKPVDVGVLMEKTIEALVDPKQQEFHVLTGIAWINKVIDHLHAGGHLNTPQWQPISTAPKDGTYILLLEGTTTFRGHWGKFYGESQSKWIDDGYVNAHKPTHWMYLPPLPEENEKP